MMVMMMRGGDGDSHENVSLARAHADSLVERIRRD